MCGTPRTDAMMEAIEAEETKLIAGGNQATFSSDAMESITELARDFERENAELREQIKLISEGKFSGVTDHTLSVEQAANAELRKQLERAGARIEDYEDALREIEYTWSKRPRDYAAACKGMVAIAREALTSHTGTESQREPICPTQTGKEN